MYGIKLNSSETFHTEFNAIRAFSSISETIGKDENDMFSPLGNLALLLAQVCSLSIS